MKEIPHPVVHTKKLLQMNVRATTRLKLYYSVDLDKQQPLNAK